MASLSAALLWAAASLALSRDSKALLSQDLPATAAAVICPHRLLQRWQDSTFIWGETLAHLAGYRGVHNGCADSVAINVTKACTSLDTGVVAIMCCCRATPSLCHCSKLTCFRLAPAIVSPVCCALAVCLGSSAAWAGACRMAVLKVHRLAALQTALLCSGFPCTRIVTLSGSL